MSETNPNATSLPGEAVRLKCAKGHHAPLVWASTKKHRWNITSQPMEMLAASGFLSLAERVGTCPRCHQDVEWSSR